MSDRAKLRVAMGVGVLMAPIPVVWVGSLAWYSLRYVLWGVGMTQREIDVTLIGMFWSIAAMIPWLVAAGVRQDMKRSK